MSTSKNFFRYFPSENLERINYNFASGSSLVTVTPSFNTADDLPNFVSICIYNLLSSGSSYKLDTTSVTWAVSVSPPCSIIRNALSNICI